MGRKFKNGKNYNIPKKEVVKVEEYSRGITKVTYTTNKSNNLLDYKRKKGNKYTDFRTGEIKKYKANPIKSTANLKRSLNNTVRPLLENNFFGENNEVFITLTYAEPMNKFLQLSKDYDRFWRRLCNKYKNSELACIYVKEMQEERQSWHIHSLIKDTNNKTLHIPYDFLYRIWGLGNVWINKLFSMYDYMSYEINIEKEMKNLPFGNVHSYNKVIDYMCKLKTKENVFPTGGKIHGKKGKLKGPVKSKMTYDEAYKDKLKNSYLFGENTLLVIDDCSNHILNSIHKEFWIKKQFNDNKNPEKTDDE